MANIAVAVILSVGAGCAIGGRIFLDQMNEAVYDYLTEYKIDPTDPMNGLVQKLPDRRKTKGQKSDEEWREISYIQAICEYARNRKGILNFYWPHRLFVLHQMYLNWLCTVPNESPIHNGKTVETFVELHLAYFQSGITGRLNSKY